MSLATPRIGQRRDDLFHTTSVTNNNTNPNPWDDNVPPELFHKTLFRYNLAAFLLQLGSGLLIVFLTDPDTKYTLYTTTYYPKSDESMTDRILPTPKEFCSIGVGYLSASFLFLSSLHHLIVCTVGKKSYETGIEQNYNMYRWIENGFSTSIMRVTIALLSGLVDVTGLVLIFGLTVVTMVFGYIFEMENRLYRLHHEGGGGGGDVVRWYIYWLGILPYLFSWGPVITYFVVMVGRGGGIIPPFVYGIVITVFLFDVTFAIVFGLQWRGKGVFRYYANGEIALILLSFVSKNALVWINFIGGNR